MKNLNEKARTYRLPETTTSENLGCDWSTVINFGDKVLLAGYYYNGRNKPSYFGAVYTYTTENHTCEGEIKLVDASEVEFEDNGHALAWGMNH